MDMAGFTAKTALFETNVGASLRNI